MGAAPSHRFRCPLNRWRQVQALSRRGVAPTKPPVTGEPRLWERRPRRDYCWGNSALPTISPPHASLRQPDRVPMRIVSNPVHQPRPDRIRDDVAGTIDQALLVAQRVIVKSGLPDTPTAAMRAHGLQLLHLRLQRQRTGQRQQAMKMIRHQHIRQKLEFSALDSSRKRPDNTARRDQVTEYRGSPDRRGGDHVGDAGLRIAALAQTVGRGKIIHA
ncbi:hypothetical protein METUNv1_01327 [Methyloversatilis universalis FAM5]|uniref:Uncharacterized protein n=1 Tax=Methyloversatilis universalis (strain ATCC BAA-1314 / DSM 25237 / JCM 13912 / CCUG 52030 / FAM5) TaxID=1000565 RepID=F5RAG6_METUF|nr:hypothetical protein METUNv1_01327 [Methyloversatilis universalis FAM5]